MTKDFHWTSGGGGEGLVEKQNCDVNHKKLSQLAELPTYNGKYATLWQDAFASTLGTVNAPAQSLQGPIEEAYLDISGRAGALFPDQARFMGHAARVMRGLIIDHARNRGAVKRGSEFKITSIDNHDLGNPADPKELSAISDALDELAKIEPDLAQLVDLKFFCGCSFAEIAALQKQSERTVQRKWEKARIYLHQSIRADLPL